MKSLLVREQVDGSTVLSTKTKYIQGHSTKLLLAVLTHIQFSHLSRYMHCIYQFVKNVFKGEEVNRGSLLVLIPSVTA